jgi:beta-glucanase (GH16 family)
LSGLQYSIGTKNQQFTSEAYSSMIDRPNIETNGDNINMHNKPRLTTARQNTGAIVVRAAFTATAALLLLGAGFTAHAQAPGNMGLVWHDEFEGAASGAQPNSAYWNYDLGGGGWGNNELETYTSSATNAHMIYDNTGDDNQALQIECYNSGGTWYSARLKTAGKVSFGPYGYFEARCKFPNAGDGYWPAFWMLGNNIGSVGWPECGEIDIAEEASGQSNNHQSLHTGPSSSNSWNPTISYNVSSATTTYHNYGANWQPGYVAWYCDGNYEGQFNEGQGPYWTFDNQTMYILLNCAIGGGGFAGNTDGTTQGAGYFDIDYVRAYENGAGVTGTHRLNNVGNNGQSLQATLNTYNGNSSVFRVADTPTGASGNYQEWQVEALGNGAVFLVNGSQALQLTGDEYYTGSIYESGNYNVVASPTSWNFSYQYWLEVPFGNGQYQLDNIGNPALSLQATNDTYYNGSGFVSGCYNLAGTTTSTTNPWQLWTFGN